MTTTTGKEDSPPAEAGVATYVYGVVRAGAIKPPALAGVADRPVSTVEAEGLAAVTSELSEDRLRVRRRDLLRHFEILDAAFAETTVVPCAFGMVLESRQAVESDLLAARRDELLALLEQLDGRAQLNITGVYDEDVVVREVVENEPEIGRLSRQSRAAGTTHLASIQLGESVATAVAARRETDAVRLLDQLSAEAEDVVVEDAPLTTVLKASFLVARGRLDRFDAMLEAVAAAEAPRLSFEVIGPLPPTAFATLEASR